eukprot:TRINITY_DN16406_c0_g1_i1.p1 TRINITY_DN16406_c0_g1~~TRINITY_DN16406_c0_g1_i1.p1  ORF type:complete len:190 (+),score=40.90 TRINITY_DN16406_c0_g1_i1:27-572(+)
MDEDSFSPPSRLSFPTFPEEPALSFNSNPFFFWKTIKNEERRQRKEATRLTLLCDLRDASYKLEATLKSFQDFNERCRREGLDPLEHHMALKKEKKKPPENLSRVVFEGFSFTDPLSSYCKTFGCPPDDPVAIYWKEQYDRVEKEIKPHTDIMFPHLRPRPFWGTWEKLSHQQKGSESWTV